jgi:hypothetical protein
MLVRVVDALGLRPVVWSRVGGLVLLAVVLVAVTLRVPAAFDWVSGEIAKTDGLTRLQREVAPARAVDLDPRPIEAAARALPADATFTVVVGDSYPFSHPISAATAPAWASYRLLPRRTAFDPSAAQWVIGYAADLPASGFTPLETNDLGYGVTLSRVRP